MYCNFRDIDATAGVGGLVYFVPQVVWLLASRHPDVTIFETDRAPFATLTPSSCGHQRPRRPLLKKAF